MSYARPRILIVDHNVDNCEMLPIWLDRNQNRYDITTCYSYREARDFIEQRRFDLYILDYLMPDMTAAQFCAMLRELDPNGPVIIYSGMNTAHVRAECIRNGADLYLVKPDDLDLLGASVEELLEHRVKVYPRRTPQRLHPSTIV